MFLTYHRLVQNDLKWHIVICMFSAVWYVNHPTEDMSIALRIWTFGVLVMGHVSEAGLWPMVQYDRFHYLAWYLSCPLSNDVTLFALLLLDSTSAIDKSHFDCV